MNRRMGVLGLIALIVLTGCSSGPSEEERAVARKKAAVEKAEQDLRSDLDAAVRDVLRAATKKGIRPAVGVKKLRSASRRAGSSASGRIDRTKPFCVWVTDVKTTTSFVYQSADDRSTKVKDGAADCDATVYPPEPVDKPVLGDSAADRERQLAYDRVDAVVRQKTTALGGALQKRWIEAPVGNAAETVAEAMTAKKKIKIVSQVFEDFETDDPKLPAGTTYGGEVDDKYFCLWVAHKVDKGQTWEYQSLTRKTVRVEPGKGHCNAANTLRR